MSGGVPAAVGLSNPRSIGAVLGSSLGTTLTASGSTFTKGAWTQLIAATAADIHRLLVQNDASPTTGNFLAFDIGVGASGAEQPIISNLGMDVYGTYEFMVSLPVRVPEGSRLSARVQSNVASDQVTVSLIGFDTSLQDFGAGAGVYDTYGYLTASGHGTVVDPGTTANTKGAWTQITSSLTNDLAGFFLGLDGAGQTTNTGSGHELMDIGIGASGSQVVIVPNLQFHRVSNSVPILGPTCPYTPLFEIPIPAGTAVWARSQATMTTAGRTMGVTLYGMRA